MSLNDQYVLSAQNLTASPELSIALNSLIDGDFQARWDAAKQIVTVGQPAIPFLVSFIKDEELDWEVRWFAARALGYLEDVEALHALVDLLRQTQDPELIAIAAEGLSRFEEAGVAALIQLFETPAYRQIAIQGLANIRHRAALPTLLIGAQDADAAVREIATIALSHFKDPEVDQALLGAVQDPATAVRQEAITCLGLRPHLLETVNLVDILLPGLWDLQPGVYHATAAALGRLGTESAVTHLSRVLHAPQTPDPLKIALVRALSWIDKDSALMALLLSRQTASVAVQLESVEALTRFRAESLRNQAGEALCDWLTGLLNHAGAGEIKRAIALALGQLRHQAARTLLHRLETTSEAQTQLYAKAALRQLATQPSTSL